MPKVGAIFLSGDKELDRALEKFEAKDQKTALRKATRAVTKKIEADAKRLVNVDSGKLQLSITTRAVKLKGRTKKEGRNVIGHSVVTRGGLFKGETYYGGFIEFGTEKFKPGEGESYLRRALFTAASTTPAAFRQELIKAINQIKAKKAK